MKHWTSDNLDGFDSELKPPYQKPNIPTAREMATKTAEKVDRELNILLRKVAKQLETVPNYSATISLTEKEEKMVSVLIERLSELGYRCEYKKGFYEDRPCGGYVSGKLTLDWRP